VASIEVKAAFSAEVIVKLYTYFTFTHILAYVQ
jgi:hypothetical protein